MYEVKFKLSFNGYESELYECVSSGCDPHDAMNEIIGDILDGIEWFSISKVMEE